MSDQKRIFDQYVHRIFAATLILIIIVAGIFLLMGFKPWARGVVLGGAASLVNLVIMAGEVRRQGSLTGGQFVQQSYGRYALRMTVIAAALVYSAIGVKVNFWATVPALFASQFIMTSGELLGNREQEPS